jgi:hypothetical protein
MVGGKTRTAVVEKIEKAEGDGAIRNPLENY